MQIDYDNLDTGDYVHTDPEVAPAQVFAVVRDSGNWCSCEYQVRHVYSSREQAENAQRHLELTDEGEFYGFSVIAFPLL